MINQNLTCTEWYRKLFAYNETLGRLNHNVVKFASSYRFWRWIIRWGVKTSSKNYCISNIVSIIVVTLIVMNWQYLKFTSVWSYCLWPLSLKLWNIFKIFWIQKEFQSRNLKSQIAIFLWINETFLDYSCYFDSNELTVFKIYFCVKLLRMTSFFEALEYIQNILNTERISI